jgi:hypothetical protein
MGAFSEEGVWRAEQALLEESNNPLENTQRLVSDIYQKRGSEPLRRTSAGRFSESAPCRRECPRRTGS